MIDDLTSVVEIGDVEFTVVVEMLGVEPCVALIGSDIAADLGEVLVAEIGEEVAVEMDGIVLNDVDAAVTYDDIGVVVHIGTVAEEDSIDV